MAAPVRAKIKSILRSGPVQTVAGSALASYLSLIKSTGRFVETEGFNPDALTPESLPGIFTFWHGQHFLTVFGVRPEWNMHVMISRSADGGINAKAVEKLGLSTVRGAGDLKGKGPEKGGMTAYRAFVRLLSEGASVAMTADVPKRARIVSPGLIRLARQSGRPIIPSACIAQRRIALSSWDRAAIPLPFSKLAVGAGEPILIDRDDPRPDDQLCQFVAGEVDRVTDAAYAACGAEHIKPPVGGYRG